MENMKEVDLNQMEKITGGRNKAGYGYEPREKEGYTIYRIKSGDYLCKIAREHGVSVNSIMRANPELEDPDFIVAGFYLYIPE